MKYIRTKDGIFSAEVEWTSKPPKNIAIKRADTIEELCDEFVIVWKDYEYKHCLWEDLQDLKLSYKDWQFDEMENIYGAIWTDKGLIYVAKMNEKGELCLL